MNKTLTTLHKLGSNTIVISVLCLIMGLLLTAYPGWSGNHATYLPPGLNLANKEFLQFDWWLNNATHYHTAFNYLVYSLETLKILKVGLITLNVVVLSISFFFIYLIINYVSNQRAFFPTLLIFSIYLISDSFFSVGDSYLFSSGLQPSSFGALGTIIGIYYFIRQRFLTTGIFIGVAGLFHTNFLLLNFIMFGLTFCLLYGLKFKNSQFSWKDFLSGGIKLLGFSFVIICFTLPLILKVAMSSSYSAEEIELANFAFFKFAVSFHYLPNTFLPVFLKLLGWQLIGLICITHLRASKDVIASLLTLHLSMAFIIWFATLLTTVVFVEQVSRLYFWRLAPFSELLSCIAMLAVFSQMLFNQKHTQRDGFSILQMATIIFGSLLILKSLSTYHHVFTFIVFGHILFLVVVLALFLIRSQVNLIKNVRVYKSIVMGYCLVILFGTMLSITTFNVQNNMSIMHPPKDKYLDTELFEYVKNTTPLDSNVLIPIDLYFFRLMAERAIVVDIKNLPFGVRGLNQWYERLEDVGGLEKPSNPILVRNAYESINLARLQWLQKKYHVTHAVVPSGNKTYFSSWDEIFKNDKYRLLKHNSD